LKPSRPTTTTSFAPAWAIGSGLDLPGFLSLLHIAPRIGDAFQEQLANKGVTAKDIYRRHEEFFALHDVAERMLDFDESMQLFRFHHLKMGATDHRKRGHRNHGGRRWKSCSNACSIPRIASFGICGTRSPPKQAYRVDIETQA
jgi:hypothetical protein